MTDLGTSIFIDLTGEYAAKAPPVLLSGSSTSDCSLITLNFDMDMIDPTTHHLTESLHFSDSLSRPLEILNARYVNDLKTFEITCPGFPDRYPPLYLNYSGTIIKSKSGILLAPIVNFEIPVPKGK